jgi:putative endonuclease
MYAQRAARRALEESGLQVIEENYRCRWGELDIVALQPGTLVFVEVRSHTVGSFGTPEESITPKKAARLRLLADHYRSARAHLDLPGSTRIDVVAVDLDRRGGVADLRVVENAVEDG